MVQRRKINPENLGSAFSPCCRAGIDAALAKADFFFAGAPTIENKIEQKTQNTKVASAKVAFDTVRGSRAIRTRPGSRYSALGSPYRPFYLHRSASLSGPISRDTAILSLQYPIARDAFSGRVAIPQNGAIPLLWHLVSHRHIRFCAIPHFATYRAIIVRYPTKTSTKEFCDTIAASIARYEKYRYWASSLLHSALEPNRPSTCTRHGFQV